MIKWLGIVFMLLNSLTVHADLGVSLGDEGSYLLKEKSIWLSPQSLEKPSDFTSLTKLAQSAQTINHSVLGTSGSYLAKIPFKNTLSTTQEWYVMPAANFIDYGIAYWQKEDGSVVELTEFSQLDDLKAPALMHGQAFRFKTTSYEQGTLWIYIQAQHYALPLNLTVENRETFLKHQFRVNTVTIAAVTIMLTLAFISFIIYLKMRLMVILACGAYLGLKGIGWATASGFIDQFFSIDFVNTTYLGMYLFPFAIAAASQFTKLLFNSHTEHPRLAKGLDALAVILVVFGLIMPWMGFSISFVISHIIAMIWIPLSIMIGVKMLTFQDFRAKYYLAGNLLYGLALAYYMLSHSVWLESAFYPELIVVSALSLDGLFIMLSLSEWLRIKQFEYNLYSYQARIDPLTKLANRHEFNQALDELEQNFVVVFIDFDGFKSINDLLGHDKGDEFLVENAKFMQDKLASLGTVYRTGGDEFVWLCQFEKASELDEINKKLVVLVEICDAEIKKKWKDSGISYGIANSFETDSKTACLSLADSRMYEYKRKNQAYIKADQA